MFRSFRVPVLLGVLALGACKEPEGFAPKMAELAPPGAQLAIGFKLAPLRKSAVADLLAAAATSDSDIAAMFTAVANCELDLDNLSATMSGRLDDNSDDFFVVIETPGVGKKDMLECLEKEGSKAQGEDPGNLMLGNHGQVRAAPMEGGGKLIQFNDDAIGIVDGSWEQEIMDRVEKQENRQTPSDLGTALAHAPADADLWVAALIDDSMRADFADFQGSDGLQHLTVEVKTGDDWTGKVSLFFSEADKAEAFKGSLDAMKEGFVAAGTEAGVPATTMESLAFEHADKTVAVSVKIPQSDVMSIAQMAGSMM